MATNTTEYISVLLRNGTDQLDRFEAGLDPGSVRLHDFGIREWMQFAYHFAQKVNFFSPEDDEQALANWKNFFLEDSDLDKLLTDLKDPDGELTPHLTLFICFLQLIELSKNRLNNVTKRHLDFYYKDILQISRLPAKEDKVFVLFELAKSVSSYLVQQGTELDGDKDESGIKRVYRVSEELATSRTRVAQIKNVYNEHNIQDEPGITNGSRYSITAASVANSSDGLGTELPPESPTWYPFGYYVSQEEATKDKTPLPFAKVGCAIGSPVLRLSEGQRRVTVTFTFQDTISAAITTDDLVKNFSVYYTAEKDWKGPYLLKEAAFDNTETTIDDKKLVLTFDLDTDQVAVENYVKKFHAEQFGDGTPVVRFLLNTNNEAGYRIYSTFADGSNALLNVQIDVHVKGMKKVVLENDTAVLNERKPFYPFTTTPVKGACFSIANEEAFAKKWSYINIDFDWKNTPDSFPSWYTAYEASLSKNISINRYKTIFTDSVFKERLDDDGNAVMYSMYDQEFTDMEFVPGQASNYKSIVSSDDYFRVQQKVLYKEEWQAAGAPSVVSLFKKDGGNYKTTFQISGNAYDEGKADAIRLVLQQSFLHELYPRLYAVALSSEDNSALIPNEPYTPFAENLTLEYEASVTINVSSDSESTFTESESVLYHEHPFGQCQEHTYLRKKNSNNSLVCRPFPLYCKGGEMYIGLENAANLDLVSLYFKVAEGTENPLAKTFLSGQKIEWSILANNVWRTFDSSLMTANETDNLLVSGKIRFTIPEYATTDNTLLEPGLFWICAKMYKRYDAVCQLHGVHAQAIEAQFENRSNSLEHLAKGLSAETIAKLVQRVSQVKGISQPYASFGGVEEETDALYYRRVSERLRHKNRAITLWDYEHLLLQQFPEVYKAKCLNHTNESDFTAPGCVTIVVVPDTVNKTVFDIYQPRVSRGLLNKINAYLSQLNSMHVQLFVINPNYEEVKIELGAKFYTGLDENNYRKQLQEDIIKFLSPWAFEASREIAFGVSFTRSTLIHYIEQLSYVDYIDGLRIYKNGVLQGNHCSPSNPKSILVSTKEHTVLSVKTTKCDEDNEQTVIETCQL